MKYTFHKKTVLRFAAYSAGIAAFLFFAYIGFEMLPSAVQYSVPDRTNEKPAISEINEYDSFIECKYRNLSDISEKGPFSVSSHKNQIYVFFEDECLYHVKAKLSEFPQKDRNTISKGITATDYSELCEIISYIES